jgi:hypothetical protein
MCTLTAPLASLALATFAWTPNLQARPVAESITIEWNPRHEAVIHISVDSEDDLARVQILRPDGRRLGQFDAPDHPERGLASLDVELREPDLDSLRANYSEGLYALRAATADGRVALGSATLSFSLPPATRIAYPRPDSLVPSSNLTIAWQPEPGVTGYELQLEQSENDGLRVRLPPARSSFQVPDGVLRPGAETSLEIASIAANGNRTVVEVIFTTQP